MVRVQDQSEGGHNQWSKGFRKSGFLKPSQQSHEIPALAIGSQAEEGGDKHHADAGYVVGGAVFDAEQMLGKERQGDADCSTRQKEAAEAQHSQAGEPDMICEVELRPR